MDKRTAWSVPGYVAEELVGFGAAGEVWRGRSLRTGETVALKRLRQPVDIAAGGQLRRQAASLAAVGHPHLLPVRAVVGAGRSAVLVLEYAAGGNLAVLLRRRGRLRPGEVVTVLSPVAAALAFAHGEGLSHGSIAPPNILFTVDGRPLLADLGVAGLVGARPDPDSVTGYLDPAVAAGAPAGPASDVFMLAVVAVHALTGTASWPGASSGQAPGAAAAARLISLDPAAPAALVRALRRALSPCPDDRGTAADLALDMRHGCQPEPVLPAGALTALSAPTRPAPASPGGQRSGAGRLGADGVGPAAWPADVAPSQPLLAPPAQIAPGPRHRRQGAAGRPAAIGRRPGRWLVGAGVVVLAASGGAAWAVASPADRPAGIASPPGPAAAAEPAADGRVSQPVSRAEWLAVLGRLDVVRARAYALGDVDLLRRVYAAGPHLAADTAQLRRIVAAGDTVRGASHRLRVVTILDRTSARVRLRVTQSLPSTLRVHAGQAVAAIPGTPETSVVIELALTADGWRLA